MTDRLVVGTVLADETETAMERWAVFGGLLILAVALVLLAVGSERWETAIFLTVELVGLGVVLYEKGRAS